MTTEGDFFNKYDDIFDNAHYFVFIYTLDGKIMKANEVMLNAFGYNYDEVVNKTFAKFLFREEQLKKALAMIKNLKKTGEMSGANIYEAKKKDGTSLHVELFGIPLRQNNQIKAVLAIGHDITDLIVAERKLEEEKEKFETIAEQSGAGILILQDDVIKYSNKRFSEISGYSLDIMKYWTAGEMFQIVHQDDRKKVIEQATRKQQGATTDVLDQYEFRGIRKDGKEKWLEIHSKSINYENEPADLVFLLDITERKLTEERIKKAYIREEFYKDLFAHDMNNILQNLVLLIDLEEIEEQNREKSNFKTKFLLSIRKQISRASSLVKNVKIFSEIDNTDINLKKINILNFLGEAVNKINKSTRNKNIKIDIISEKKDYIIAADDFIQYVFENLFYNSITFNDNLEVKIEIKLSIINEKNHGVLKLEFHDNGRGIPDSKKKSIFLRGFLEDRTVSGLGLGLSLVKVILDRYNATIQVEDNKIEGKSKGSNFIIKFPIEAN